jgi:ubiquinone/menaquinone biosynthesis C-methylase UbiE
MASWKLGRMPEPEEMNDAGEVESYSSAAAARHLKAIDGTFVQHALRLIHPSGAGWGLDVGTGPAEIPIQLLRRLPSLRIIGVDRSANMLARARQNAAAAGVRGRFFTVRADAHALPFRDGVFSMVLSNSVLHHARDPVALLREMNRVAAPDGALLLRDLRRPSFALLLPWHLWRHGRHYHGTMRRLFDASVRAAYTFDELGQIIRETGLQRLAPFRCGGAHLGCERAAR